MRNLILLLLVIAYPALAQQSEKLSYAAVLDATLKNNYEINIAANNAEQAKILNNVGNAGFLPKVSISGGVSSSGNNTRQEFSSGLVVDKNNVSSDNMNIGAYLNWTLFDGLKMFATKERLSLLEKQGELSFKMELERKIEQVSLQYYKIVMQQQLIQGLQAASALSELRMKIAQKKSEIGSGSGLELLQAKLDNNAQKANLIQQQNLLKEYKLNLLQLMKAEMNNDFKVDSVFAFDAIESMEQMKQRIESSNRQLNYLQRNKSILLQNRRELNADYFPKLGLTGSYVFAKTQNAAGFALLNQNLGYTLGLNLNWTIFNGFTTRNQLKVLQLQLENSQLQIDFSKATLFTAAQSAYLNWLGQKEIMELEEENGKLANQVLMIATERLKLGLGNYLEIKESEKSYEAALARLVNARYNLKSAEINLKKLSGELLK